jgi:branched-chain amino acid aminotransferase
MKDGGVNIFRLERHYHRFQKSLERMCMAVPPKELFTEGLIQLVKTDADWVPEKRAAALYLRPFVYASEPMMGVKVSEQYRFVICTGPVPELFARPVKVKVETHYVRASKGGTGFAKCGGNYGAAFLPLSLAKKEGYDQILWTDAKENRFIEESGTMNAMFVINNTLVTPPLSDSILEGITRDSILTLAKDMGYAIAERPISLDELEQSFMDKTITEAFGAGTAAVVAPIQLIHMGGIDYTLPAYTTDSLSSRIKLQLEKIRGGEEADTYGWNTII